MEAAGEVAIEQAEGEVASLSETVTEPGKTIH